MWILGFVSGVFVLERKSYKEYPGEGVWGRAGHRKETGAGPPVEPLALGSGKRDRPEHDAETLVEGLDPSREKLLHLPTFQPFLQRATSLIYLPF